MAVAQETLIGRLDRLDNLMRYLEEMKGSNSSPSTPTSGITRRRSEGNSFMQMDGTDESSTRRREKHYCYKNCRPVEAVMMEMEEKGSLLDRVTLMEERLLDVTLQLKQMMEADKTERSESDRSPRSHPHNKGFKHIVKSCVHAAAKSMHK